MEAPANPSRSYRCYYHPLPDAPAESGVLPYIQVLAASAEDAARRAHAVLGKPVDRVERLEPAAGSLILGPGVSFEVRA
ncbi:hypothetical protein P7L53_15905 [Thermoleptolyngbya sichuanensis XZ-Cy5]|nr:hypothetical protein [Thermoleptolyngbya sichuanensis XZ-Cy5]